MVKLSGENQWSSLWRLQEELRKTFVRTACWLYKLMCRHHFEDIQTDERNKHYNCKNISPVLVCATCSTHLILFDLINPTTLGKMYNL